jgi:hypothetical protein
MYPSTQAKLLRSLEPNYQQAIQDDRVEEFFQQAYLIWFDRFPEPRDRSCTSEEYAWAIEVQKKVCS